MKKLLSIILSLVMLLSALPIFDITALADDLTTGSCGENVTYSYDSDSKTLTISGTGAMYDYSSSNSPFYNNTQIQTLVIDNGVTVIGRYAFKGCTIIRDITIPNSIIRIGVNAFSSSILIARTVRINSLEAWCNITFESETSNPFSGMALSNNKLYLNDEQIIDLVIPSGVTYLKDYAFYNYKKLQSVTISSTVTSVSPTAFGNCSNLTSITVDSGNPRYDSRDNCNGVIETSANALILGIKSTVIPEGITKIGDYAFYYSNGLNAITLPNSLTRIGNYAFSTRTGLTEINIPDGVTSIGNYAFYGCTGLTSVTLGSNVTSIGAAAFRGCTGLTEIALPNSVTSIGNSAFYECTGLTNITITNSACTVGNSASTLPENAKITAHINSQAKAFADTYSREFTSLCNGYYEQTERVEPISFTENGYIKYNCSVCGSEKTEPLVQYLTVDDGTRFASNSYVLPVSKAFVYNGKLYARFDKPIANFSGLYSVYFKFPELQDENTLSFCRELLQGCSNYYIVGGQRSDDIWIWQYSQETISASAEWDSGQPDNYNNNENQLSINAVTGLYNDVSLSSTSLRFIACTDFAELNSQIRGSTYFKTNKYVFYNNTMPCSYARLICEAQGGHLATVADSQENTVINNLAQMDVVIGGIRNSDGNFEWITGEPFTYTNWSSGEPNNSSNYGGQYYVNMTANGAWDDDSDKTTSNAKSNNGFVCEYEPSSLSVRIDQDSSHLISDNEIHILANYPDGTSNDITDIATFSKILINGKCEVTASAVKPNGETLSVTQSIDVEGEHSFVTQVVTAPTCTKDGLTAYICNSCKYRYDEVVPATGHSYNVSRRIEATCTESGYIQYTCSMCGEKYKEYLDATGHSWSEWETIVYATEDESGTEQKVCALCGETETREIPATGHSFEFYQTVAPTCTQQGYDEFRCSNCDLVKKENYQPSLGHIYENTVVEPTCTEKGYTLYTCSRCGASYISNYKSAVGHSFSDYIFNNDSTSLFAGTETATCINCGITHTRNVSTTVIYAEPITAYSGENISVPIRIKNNVGLMGYEIAVNYDPEILTPVSVTRGDLITSGLDDNLQGDSIPGKYKIIWYGTENLTDNGILMYLNFSVNDKAIDNTFINISYSQENTFNEDFEDVIISCENVSVSVASNVLQTGALTPDVETVSPGDIVCISGNIGLNPEDVQNKTVTQTFSYDKSAFEFLGYADKNKQLVYVNNDESTGTIIWTSTEGYSYDINNQGADLGQYIMFRAKSTAKSGDYEFGYDINVSDYSIILANGCTVTINDSGETNDTNVRVKEGLSGEYNDTVTVPVNISNNKGIMGYMINVEYNPEQLEIVLAQRGTSFPGNFNDTIGVDDTGAFSVLWNGTDNVSADGVLMTLTFKVLTDEPTVSPITITYSQDDTFNSDYDDVVLNCINGSINLNEEETHEFTDEVVLPTPNTKGYIKHTCINCGYSYTDCETDYANDMSALTSALEKFNEYSAEDYSAQSYALLQNVYNRYKDYPDKSIPQTAIDNATSDILTAITNLVPYLFLTVKSDNGTVTVNNLPSAQKYSLLFGDSVTVTAVADDGYIFDGWYETVTKRIRSTDETFTFKITSNTDFEARFIKEQTATLSFESDDGWIAGKVDKTVSEWADVTTIEGLVPDVPYKLGFTNGRWIYNENEVLTRLRSGENVVITPEYDATDYANPIIPTPVGKEPALDLYYKLDADNNVGSFIMATGIPENCEVESIGVAFYCKKASEFDPTDFDVNINNKMLTSKFEPSNESGYYTVDVKKFTNKKNWAVKGYVTYYDQNGNLKTAYSNQINIIDRQQV